MFTVFFFVPSFSTPYNSNAILSVLLQQPIQTSMTMTHDIQIIISKDVFFFFFVIRHSFTIEDLVSAPNLKLGCAVILRGCASDYK